ncbi:DNA polymerase III subunit delta [Clostridium tarantellae]|uniref:DNA polymerase III subunit delta n=1 Tax=Clostridium tarantellae TaxID=39493 RepID=A0A6I1MGF1_9CLOT|nr:DNA polymerase III subunit delta [Clostridium tarantellae]MPQ42260.1 DNA polymerase III subunit delta [Clostridium tarantellae]
MIDLELLHRELNEGKIRNCYIFCGLDEMLIKESIDTIVNKAIDKDFRELNITKIDGNNFKVEDFKIACETVPFLSEKKAIIVDRVPFLKEKLDSENQKNYNECIGYFKNPPDYCVLIVYVLLKDKRERINKLKKLMTLDKEACIVSIEKLKGEKFYKKVGSIFLELGGEISKVELRYFCELVENNFDIIKREVDKLVNYSNGRPITKKDIEILLPHKSESDIFDLVEFISIRKANEAIDLMNELVNKGENPIVILSQIRDQFQKLYRIKMRSQQGYKIEEISKDFKGAFGFSIPPFVVEKFINQGKKFSNKQINKCIKVCMESEKKLKSTNIDGKTELELMIINCQLP